MRYGILSVDDWEPSVEGYPDNARCIVLLNNDGSIAIDELYAETSATMGERKFVGTGVVVLQNDYSAQGYIPIPLDVSVRGMFDSLPEAADAAYGIYRSPEVALETDINQRLEENALMDDYIDNVNQRNRNEMFANLLIVGLAALLVVLVIYALFIRGSVPILP